MGWKDVAKLASEWADAKKDELLTADRRKRENAEHRAEVAEERAKEEIGTSFLERVLPPALAEKVTAARPENVAARRAEADARAEEERRERLAEMSRTGATAELNISISGGENGSLTVTLPCELREERPDPSATYDDGYDDLPPPLAWLYVNLEAVDPVPVGTTTLAALSLAVPDFHGPGRYDLADLYRRGEAGEISGWEVFDLYLTPTAEADDRTWYVDVYGEGPVVVEVTDSGLSFDVPMASAVSSIRATGTITW